MQDYENLVKFLRGLSPWAFPDASNKRMQEAAAAIEALNRLLDQNTQRCEALRKQLREAHESYERHLNELEAQLPKRGEWKCSYPEIEPNPMFMYGICSICGFEQSISNKLNYCPNCGAKMNDSNASNALNALDNAQDGPIITPCRGCSDYDGYGGCKSKGGCARAKTEVQDGQA